MNQINQWWTKSDKQYNKRNLQLNESTNSTEIENITEPPCDPKLRSANLVLSLVMDKYIYIYIWWIKCDLREYLKLVKRKEEIAMYCGNKF